MVAFILNRDSVQTDLPAGMVVLDYLRRHQGLTGSKEGCREGDCGACMVLVGELRTDGVFYRPVNSCLLPLASLAGRHLVTIEGLNSAGLNPIQQAFVEEGATQCGFCTPGFIVSFMGFLLSSPGWDTESGLDAMAGNLCRCTGHVAIRRAAERVCAGLSAPPPANLRERIAHLCNHHWLPAYFLEIPDRLRQADLSTAATDGDVPFGGGTDLFVQRPDELLEAKLRLLYRRDELRGLRMEQDRCVIGAATRWADIEDSPLLRDVLPGLAGHLKLVASRPIRHRATIGGNLVNASPIGDLSILLLALDAELALAAGEAQRTVRLRDFFLGYKKLSKRLEELVTQVSFRVPPPGVMFSFEKVSRREHLDIASVNSAMLAVRQNGRAACVHLSAGGVAPVPLYLARASQQLTGAPVTVANLRAALEAASTEISPISDVRGSADYKRGLLRQLLTAHFLRLAPEFEGELTS
jgi:xanthine dehydrogenase small subunit